MYNTQVMEKKRGILPSTLNAIEVLSKGGDEVKAWPLDNTQDLVVVKNKRTDKVYKIVLGEEQIKEIQGLNAPEILDSEL